MKTVTLANQTRAIQVFNLPFELVPELATRGIVGTRDHDSKTGERSVRANKKKISGSITLMPKGVAGDIVSGLPESVLKAPEVDRALKMWPPKIASKVQNQEEREKDAAQAAKDAEEAAAARKEHAALLKIKKERRAAIHAARLGGGAPVEPVATKTKAPRMERGAKE